MQKSPYLEYLMDMVGADSNLSLLCSYLLSKEFTWDRHFITDMNRAEDGEDLRITYIRDTGEVSGIDGTARVLEVLVALAIRIDRDIMGEPDTYEPGPWFDLMLEHLGISYMTDRYFVASEADEKVTRWMERTYDRDGEGSLFPLRHTNLDQRGITIWDQMSEWIIENC